VLVGESICRYTSADGTYVCDVDFTENPIVTSTLTFAVYLEVVPENWTGG